MITTILISTLCLQAQDQVDERSAAKQATKLTATATAKVNIGETVSYQAKLETRSEGKDVAKRLIQVKLDGTVLASPVTSRNGIVKGSFTAPPVGSHQLLFVFDGDSRFGKSSVRKNISVFENAKVDLRIIEVKVTKQTDGVSTLVNVKVQATYGGKPLAGVKVTADRPGKPSYSGPSSTSVADGTLFLSAGLLGHGNETWKVYAFGEAGFRKFTSDTKLVSVVW